MSEFSIMRQYWENKYHYKISYYIQNFSKNEIACYSIACEDGKSVIIVELHVQCNFIFFLCSIKQLFFEETTSISWYIKTFWIEEHVNSATFGERLS